MPHINRIRVNNVKYNFGTQYYDDFVMRFSGKNAIYDLANGGGKSVLMLLLLQNLIPNCTLDEKQPVEKLFRSGNGNTCIHSLIEWKLNPCHVRNGFQYMTTGFCARKARGSAEEEGETFSDRAAIDYFNYCIFYRQFNDNDLKNLPLTSGKERITYLGLRSYLQELEKKDLHVEVHIFDRKGDYQNYISQYGLFESEWEIIRGINKTEGHVRTYFETNYRTTRKVVEDLLIEEIIEKSFYRKTGTDQQAAGMAGTLLELKDQLVLLSRKKSEMHYYDRQIGLLVEFASRVGSLQGMYRKKQGLEEQLVKTYHTTLKRREQKEHAHEVLTEKTENIKTQKQEVTCQMELARILKAEHQLKLMEQEAEEKQKKIDELSVLSLQKSTRLEERECDNYYLNYLEYRREFLSARTAVEEILKGSLTLEKDLFAMANEWKAYAEQEQAVLAEEILRLQEQTASLETVEKKLQSQEKAYSIELGVLDSRKEKINSEREELQRRLTDLFREENMLFFSDTAGELRKAEEEFGNLSREKKKLFEKMESCVRELCAIEVQNQNDQKEEKRLAAQLEELNGELAGFQELIRRMDQLIEIYGGTYESVENILFQQQKELVLSHRRNVEEKGRLQRQLLALADGIFAPQPEKLSLLLEDVARYYDDKAISGYEYLRQKEEDLRAVLQERYPMLPFAVVTDAELEKIAEDGKLREKDFGEGLIPVISREALEREKDILEETSLVFLGRSRESLKVKERLKKLEESFAREYEIEKVLKSDYDFVQSFLHRRQEMEQKQGIYDRCKSQWKQILAQREENQEKNRQLKEQEVSLKKQAEALEISIAEAKAHAETLEKICRLEAGRKELETQEEAISREQTLLKHTLSETGDEFSKTADLLENTRETLDHKRQELKRVMECRDIFQNYVTDEVYPATGMDQKELEIAFAGKKAAFEQKNSDVSDKQKLVKSYEKSMEQQKEQLQLLGHSLEEMEARQQKTGCIRTEMEQLLVLKKEAFDLKNRLILLENEKKTLEAAIHKTMGSISNARSMAEEKYGPVEMPEIAKEQLEGYMADRRKLLEQLDEEELRSGKQLRELEEQCYALKAMAQDMERMMKSAEISPEGSTGYLETGTSLKEQYEQLRQAYEKIVKEEGKRLEAVEKEKFQLTETLEKMGAYELSREIKTNLTPPENEQQIEEQIASLKSVGQCLELEKERISKDMDSLQELKDQFEAQCLQSCLNMKEELDRLQKLSKISMDQQMISMITLQIPYLKEEQYKDSMSAYIDQIIRQVDNYETQAERLNYIRSQLAFKRLFSVIVTNMDSIRLTLYKRERMKEQSRYLKYEEAVGSTGQSQGIYIQFLVAIINYISSINSGNADPLELKKVIFIDNPFGAAKDVYIWEPIFKLLKANNVQLIVPARGATPAITGHFEVNYILGQKLIDGRQQTVVVDYRSQTEEKEMEYETLEYRQETLSFF